MLKLDYSLNTPEERKELVEKILEENPNPPERYLEILADYLVLCMEKQEKREKKILTENRLATINKRETSLEGLASQFENGEDGLYDLIVENDKGAIFRPKIGITQKDLETIPELKQIQEAIHYWEDKLKTASGKDAYICKKAIIDFRKDQYLVKDGYLKPVQIKGITKGSKATNLDGDARVSPTGVIETSGVSLMNPTVCSAILCNYNQLHQKSEGAFHTDLWAVMFDFDRLFEKTMCHYPILRLIAICKIAGLQNLSIQKALEIKFQTTYSVEHISSLWRKKIPNLLADQAQEDYLNWYYLEVEKGQYKTCGRCGQTKLALPRYFSKNRTSKDGWYSICKECRNKKKDTLDEKL